MIDTEYIGVVSAFLHAGAISVVSTLWNVYELSNTWLILKFYELFQSNSSPSQALKSAQTWLRTVSYMDLLDWLKHWLAQLPQNNPYRTDLQDEIALIQNGLNAHTIEPQDQPYQDFYHWAAFTLTGKGELT